MITLYDLAFEEDRRPSPFCWRTKFSLAHKGLDFTSVPMGFTEKEKIAFADSKTVPVLKDGEKPIKDSWAIAVYLDEMYPEKLLLKSEMGRSYARFINGWADTVINAALFPLIVGDLYDRVRPEDKPYFAESRGARLGTQDFTGFQAKAREKGLAALRTALEPARRALREQKFLSGAEAAYPDYILAGTFMWPRTISPLELLEPDDPVHAWRERMLDLFGGMARKAKTA
ncbi:glutathione S-transferase N-terminal domain-containing protein [Reyranella aquatilis]|uniref:Glutathione S-transferase N-terminal domain-containing protein n=1 Tax=Reyranella aquatilis TaxID=2035356 RepID=A0ABS8KP31_9HYPH|nr:glutathione S-transferase N-terminal domain-containing protein [Reyranella aquatilis]MCC8427817.1 glutathione S-transferase N-terminal domain-containing protein [Reyranella aquatilis]